MLYNSRSNSYKIRQGKIKQRIITISGKLLFCWPWQLHTLAINIILKSLWNVSTKQSWQWVTFYDPWPTWPITHPWPAWPQTHDSRLLTSHCHKYKYKFGLVDRGLQIVQGRQQNVKKQYEIDETWEAV